MTCSFQLGADSLVVVARADAIDGASSPEGSFGWQVLNVLVDEVEYQRDDQSGQWIRLVKQHSALQAPTWWPTILGEIKRHFRDHTWAMRVPRRLKELHLALNNATSELTQQLSRAPNPTELAAHLNVERDEILDALAVANGYRSDSLDEPIRGEPDLPSLLDTLGEDDPYLEGVEYREVLQPLLADMPARERTIVVLRFFGNLTQS